MVSNPQQTPWYVDWFGEDYLLVYAHRDETEARKMVDLAEKLSPIPRGSRVLDLACGAGRHAVEMARRGMNVTGLDLSQTLLSEAKRWADECGETVSWVNQDMRQTVDPGGFDLVVNLFTSFGYFDTDAENQAVLSAIHNNLRPSGGFVMDYLNRDCVINNLIEHDEAVIDGVRVVQHRTIDPITSRVEKAIEIEADGQHRVYRESVRMYIYPELFEMAQKAGLKIDGAVGDYDGGPYTLSSPRMMLYGHREDL